MEDFVSNLRKKVKLRGGVAKEEQDSGEESQGETGDLSL